MTEAVVSDLTPQIQAWDTPPNIGAPNGQLIYSPGVDGITIAATIAEITTINIHMGLPIGWAYRLMEARIQLVGLLADLDEYSRVARGSITAFNPNAPADSISLPFSLGSDQIGLVNGPDAPGAGGLAAARFLSYGPTIPLPNVPIIAVDATTVADLFMANTADTTGAINLQYYVRFLRSSSADDFRWRMHTPLPVTQ